MYTIELNKKQVLNPVKLKSDELPKFDPRVSFTF